MAVNGTPEIRAYNSDELNKMIAAQYGDDKTVNVENIKNQTNDGSVSPRMNHTDIPYGQPPPYNPDFA